MTKRKPHIWIFLIIVLQALPSIAMASSSFFDERYRGWFWFENKEKNADDSARNQNNRASNITPMEAKAEIEQFAIFLL